MRHEITREITENGQFVDPSSIFIVEGSNNVAGWGFGGWDKTGSHRVDTGGPLVQGPCAYLFGLCGVIDGQGGTGTINAEADRDGRLIRASAGDVVSVNGIDFDLTLCSRGYPYLKKI